MMLQPQIINKKCLKKPKSKYLNNNLLKIYKWIFNSNQLNHKQNNLDKNTLILMVILNK